MSHGHGAPGRRSPTYHTWTGMLQRCTNPRHKSYPKYGGRGVTVCRRWRRFDAFLADMGRRPRGKTLDRRDNDGNYDSGNCRWATIITQRRNQRRYRAARAREGT